MLQGVRVGATADGSVPVFAGKLQHLDPNTNFSDNSVEWCFNFYCSAGLSFSQQLSITHKTALSQED